jgi:hypothetical protein
MATAHGAGLMLLPALLPLGIGHSLPAADPQTHAGHAAHAAHAAGASLATGLAAVGVHTLAMLAVAGLIAFAVYDWVGVAFLRRGWINLDRLWTAALLATGALLLLS